jgi:hypothetical protein
MMDMANMLTHTTIAEVARALATRAEDISVDLLGEPTSKSRNEYRWGRRGSLWLNLDSGRWHDHEHGLGGDLLDLIVRVHGVQLGEAIKIAERDYLGGAELRPAARRPQPARPTGTHDAEDRIKAALRIWDETVPLAGTLAERYFVEHRWLDIARLDLDHCLRWHQGIRAVVALMTDPVSNVPIGIHRTFLDREGAKLERKMLGRQGVVRLSPGSEVTMGLGMTEGVEDGLAVLLSGWAPVWAATSAGAISRFPVLAGIEALTIFGDADEVGNGAAETCAKHWLSLGRDARVAVPRRPA